MPLFCKFSLSVLVVPDFMAGGGGDDLRMSKLFAGGSEPLSWLLFFQVLWLWDGGLTDSSCRP